MDQLAKAPDHQNSWSESRKGERGEYLSFVETLQSCLLARDGTVSIMRFEEASVEESSECCQTTWDSQLLGPSNECNGQPGGKRNEGKACKDCENMLGAGR